VAKKAHAVRVPKERDPQAVSGSSVSREQLAACLEALGVDANVLTTGKPIERVYAALVRLWREHKRPPETALLCVKARVSRTQLHTHLNTLIDHRRVLRVGQAIYVPVVEQE